MGVINRILERAKQNPKKIVLPEGEDKRTVDAAIEVLKTGVAELVLLGDKKIIMDLVGDRDISKATIIEPQKSELFEKFIVDFCELRKAKGMTPEKSRELMMDNVYFGAMMVKQDLVDGMVSGAVHATSDLLRPALQIIKSAPGISTVSSFFLMEFEDKTIGDNGVYIYSDCGVVIDPNAEELAAIAIASANSARQIAELEPRIGMLSFSTKGSAKHEFADKVITATNRVKELVPDLVIDGELQVDAAIVPSVAASKAPGSPIEGRANVLIFPDINAGNIAYKLTQRLAKATAVGPICQGFAKPVNDLSRGCNANDIVFAIAITVLQAQ